jgi:ubiquinone/menaquinone biosynthesis C-methylase UbiE
MIKESIAPVSIIADRELAIRCYDDFGENIDLSTVHSFGVEWQAFNDFKEEEINKIGDSYFDIVKPEMLGKDKIAADFGCGTGRWTKYLHNKVGAIAAIDPSEAILSAAHLLKGAGNVYLYKASIDNLPFPDNNFDFGFSLGVLHHIPDTAKAMEACVQKIKPGGYFLVYLYYSLDNRGPLYRSLFWISNLVRRIVSRMPDKLKKFSCNLLAICFYMPFVLLSRLLKLIGVPKKVRSYIPLNAYEGTSSYIIRNDALDRFGTPLEQRFSRKTIEEMMSKAGLDNIIFSENTPYWHAVGRKI